MFHHLVVLLVLSHFWYLQDFLGQAESNFLYVGFFAVIISIIGLLDDLYNFKWYIKLFFQIIIVYIPLYNLNIFINFESLIGVEFNNSLNYIVSTIWIMLIMNAINFIDNMDGLAVVVSSAICIQIAVLTNYLNQYKLTDISILLLCAIGGFYFSISHLQNYTLGILEVYLLDFA